MISEKTANYFDIFIQIIPIPFLLLWTANSIYKIVTVNPFVFTSVWLVFTTVRIHALTMLVLIAFYFYTFFNLNYLLPCIRVPVTLAFTVLALHFYDFVGITCEWIVTRSGNPLIQLASFLGTSIIVILYNRKYRFFNLNNYFTLWVVIFSMLMILLSASDFFPLETRRHNWLWFAGKFTGVWLWSNIYMKRGGLE